MLERAHVRVGEIAHVHVIAHARAVGRVVIVAVHQERRPFSERRADRERNEVRFGIVTLAEADFRARARCVEISKGAPHAGVGLFVARERGLEDSFRFAVRAFGRERMLFGDRNFFRASINGGARRKHKTFHARIERMRKKFETGDDVRIVVRARIRDRIGDYGATREVHDRIDSFFAHRARDARIANVRTHERNGFRQNIDVARAQIVNHNDFFHAGARERMNDV